MGRRTNNRRNYLPSTAGIYFLTVTVMHSDCIKICIRCSWSVRKCVQFGAAERGISEWREKVQFECFKIFFMTFRSGNMSTTWPMAGSEKWSPLLFYRILARYDRRCADDMHKSQLHSLLLRIFHALSILSRFNLQNEKMFGIMFSAHLCAHNFRRSPLSLFDGWPWRPIVESLKCA